MAIVKKAPMPGHRDLLIAQLGSPEQQKGTKKPAIPQASSLDGPAMAQYARSLRAMATVSQERAAIGMLHLAARLEARAALSRGVR